MLALKTKEAKSQGMAGACGRWDKKGNGLSPRASRKNAAPPTPWQ